MKLKTAGIVLIVAVISVVIPSAATAQVGALAGYNSANVSFELEDADGFNISGDRRDGFAGGVTFNVPVQEMFSVEIDALFAQKGTEFTISEDGESETGKAKLNYIDIPVLARVNVPAGQARVHLLVGPSFNFKVSEALEPEEDLQDDQFESFESAIVFGGGFKVNRFRVDVRYGLGLTNILADEEGLTGKNRVFSVLVGFER